MSKKVGIVFVTVGAVLIIAALLLLIYNRQEDEQAGQSAEKLLEDVQSVILEQIEDSAKMIATMETDKTEESEESPELESTELTVVEIDGYGYIGYLSIPTIGIELPVMSDWDYKRLKLSPCRQSGSTQTDDLVIVAHNYKRHFGLLSRLKAGDTVTFTEMDATENSYAVTQVEVLEPTQVETVLNSDHDLVLYTCTYGGATRVVVFCDRLNNEM